MKSVAEVFETKDYGRFKILDGNRPVNEIHLHRLKKSFERKYLFSPIVINEKWEIIDGQHRFHVAKELNLPIYFVCAEGYGIEEVQLLNTNMKNWKKEDYLNSYCLLGKDAYLKFREFMEIYPDFGIAACEVFLTQLLSGKQSRFNNKCIHLNYFENGDLEIPDFEKSCEIADRVLDFKKHYDGYYRITFVRAIVGILNVETYDHQKMMDRLIANPEALHHCNSITQYRELIEEVYNYRSRIKVSFKYV